MIYNGGTNEAGVQTERMNWVRKKFSTILKLSCNAIFGGDFMHMRKFVRLLIFGSDGLPFCISIYLKFDLVTLLLVFYCDVIIRTME